MSPVLTAASVDLSDVCSAFSKRRNGLTDEEVAAQGEVLLLQNKRRGLGLRVDDLSVGRVAGIKAFQADFVRLHAEGPPRNEPEPEMNNDKKKTPKISNLD